MPTGSRSWPLRVRLPRAPQGYSVGEAGVWVDVPDEAVVECEQGWSDAGVAVLRQRHARGAVLPAGSMT